jgi:hypothetical protein
MLFTSEQWEPPIVESDRILLRGELLLSGLTLAIVILGLLAIG